MSSETIPVPAESTRVPTILVMDPECRAQRAVLSEVLDQIGDRVDVTIAIPDGTAADLPHRVIETSDVAYQFYLRTSPLLVVLEPAAEIHGYYARQCCVSVVPDEQYVSLGLPIKDLASSPSISASDLPARSQALVYGAAKNEFAHVGQHEVRFSTQTSLSDVGSAAAELLRALLHRTVTPTRHFFVLAPGAHEREALPVWFTDVVAAEVATGRADATMVSNEHPARLEASGFPFTTVIRPDLVRRAYPPEQLSAETVVVFSNTAQLSAAGLVRPGGRFVVAQNLALADPDDATIHTIEALAADSTAFYIDRLDRAYSELGCSHTLVSLIVPHFNTHPDKLVRCLESALRCRSFHANTEVLLIDDGSADDVQPELADRLGAEFEFVSWYRKDNEGLGPTRNFGIDHAAGEYVFFLDSDDEIVSENLPRLLAHAALTASDCVTGKRILCDDSGRFLSSSLDYTFGGVARSVTSSTVNIYDDQMANNRLIRRRALVENGLYFEPGFYEDNLFVARLYSELQNLEFLNLPIHRWYQYGSGESITKTASLPHIRDKLSSTERTWQFLGDQQRRARLTHNVNNELPHFLGMARALPAAERAQIARQASSYVNARKQYIDPDRLTRTGLDLVESISNNQLEQHLEASSARNERSGRVYFFPRTHFQTLQAMAYTLEHRTRSVVVILEGAAGFTPAYVYRLHRTGIFDEVITYPSNVIAECVAHEAGLGSGADPAILTTLQNCLNTTLPTISESDVGAFFTEGLPEVYAIKRRFARVFKFEDGYQSTNREFTLSREGGIWGAAQAKVGVWGPLNVRAQHARSALDSPPTVIEKMYVSKHPDVALLVDEYSGAEVVVEDYKELAARHRDVLRSAMRRLYGRLPSVEPGATIILTQPLFFSYCSMEEHVRVALSLAELAHSDSVVYLKPHPMDPVEYGAAELRVLPARIPFEYFELENIRFRRAITFGSSAIERSSILDETVNIFPLEGFDADDVRAKIREVCSSSNAPEELVRSLATKAEAARRKPAAGSGLTGLEVMLKKAGTARRLIASDRTLLRKSLGTNAQALLRRARARPAQMRR